MVSAPPDAPATGDGGAVVHGAGARDAAAGAVLPTGSDVTGSTQPRGERAFDAGGEDSRGGKSIDAPEDEPDGSRGVAEVRDASPTASATDAAGESPSNGTTTDARVDTPVDARAAAATPTAAASPAWAAPLLGRWATRVFYFSQDDFGTVSRAEQLAVVEFVGDGDSVVLNTELCLSTIENTLSRMRLVDPSAVPVRTEQVRYSEVEQRFRTEGPPLTVGYTREPPLPCTGQVGKQVPKLPEQAWLVSTCQCSTVVDDIEADDCRVVDPDEDEKPGLSYVLTVKATGTSTTYYAAMTTSSHFVNGQVSSDGGVPTASVLADDTPFQFGCSPAGCLDIASLGKACPSPYTRTSFVRLAPSETITCAELVSRASTLFPGQPPGYPARCF